LASPRFERTILIEKPDSEGDQHHERQKHHRYDGKQNAGRWFQTVTLSRHFRIRPVIILAQFCFDQICLLSRICQDDRAELAHLGLPS
jgi:hypothetical protein